MELNGGRPTRQQFVQLFYAHFGPPLNDSPSGELAMLWCYSAVDDFRKHLIALTCCNTSLTEPQQIQLFIIGLGDPLHTDVALLPPASLDDAIIFSQAYKLCNASQGTVHHPSSWVPTRSTYKPALSSTSKPVLSSATASASVNKPSAGTIRLTPAEIAQRHTDNKCFHCDELFTNGHKLICKQHFSIEVVDADADTATEGAEPTISIHAVTGI
jgi:hypothetical protein